MNARNQRVLAQRDTAPTIYVDSDQWFDDGFVYFEGLVYRFQVDRKEQREDVVGAMTPKKFLAENEDARLRGWLLKLLPDA